MYGRLRALRHHNAAVPVLPPHAAIPTLVGEHGWTTWGSRGFLGSGELNPEGVDD
jgi:hypothetical protein